MGLRLVIVCLMMILTTACAHDHSEYHVKKMFSEKEGEWIDLSHAYGPDTIYWPTDTLGFQLEELAYGTTDSGYFYSAYSFATAEHGGTHLDAPIHFAKNGLTADEIPLSSLVGSAVVVDVSHFVHPDYEVSVQDLRNFEKEHERIHAGSILLIDTGWSKYWNDRKQYLGTDKVGEAAIPELRFPGLSPDAARWLVKNRQIAACGIDTASIDFGQSKTFDTHVVLLSENVPVFENLTNLDRLQPVGSIMLALPMKIKGGSGGPLRAVAFVPN